MTGEERNAEYLRLRSVIDIIIERAVPQAENVLELLRRTSIENPIQALDQLFALLKSMPQNMNIALLEFLLADWKMDELWQIFHSAFCLPKPLNPKYRHLDLILSNNGQPGTGVKLTFDVYAQHEALKANLAALAEVLPVTGADIMVTLAFDVPENPDAAKAELKGIVAVVKSLAMLNAIAYKLLGCIDVLVDRVGTKVTLCVKAKPEFRMIVDCLWDIVRVLIPIEGENESAHLSWSSKADCSQIAQDPSLSLGNILLSGLLHFQYEIHTEHLEAILKALRRIDKTRQPETSLYILSSIMQMVSGKVRAGFSMLTPDWHFSNEAYPAKTVAEFKTRNALQSLIARVPLAQKIFEFARGYISNVEFAIYVPHFGAKLALSLPQFNKLLSSLIE